MLIRPTNDLPLDGGQRWKSCARKEAEQNKSAIAKPEPIKSANRKEFDITLNRKKYACKNRLIQQLRRSANNNPPITTV